MNAPPLPREPRRYVFRTEQSSSRTPSITEAGIMPVETVMQESGNMTYVIRTAIIFSVIAAITVIASSGAVYAQGRFLDRVNTKTVKELRAQVRDRVPSQTNQNGEGVKLKLDRAGLRRYIDRYLPRN